MPSNQMWKKPFKKNGYPAEEVEISTKGKIVGDYIVLPRKFFKLEGTSALYRDPEDNQYKGATIDTSGTFLLAQDLDEDLSDELSVNVYTRIQLNHSNVANTTLKITYYPYGDILDPVDFQQELSPDSDVQHNSLLLSAGLTSNSVATQSLSSETAVIGGLLLTSMQVDEVSIGSGPNKLTYDPGTGLLMIAGKTFPHIAPANLVQAKTLTLLTLNPANFLEIIPVDYIKIDAVNQDLSIQNIKILDKLQDLEARIEALEE